MSQLATLRIERHIFKKAKPAASPCAGCIAQYAPALCKELGTPAECSDSIFIVAEVLQTKRK